MWWWHSKKSLSEAQRWALAAGGILTRMNNEGFDLLRCQQGADAARFCLREGWGVNNARELADILRWLWQQGHRADCAAYCAEVRTSDSAALPAEDASGTMAFVSEHLGELETSRLIGWDLSRLIQVARWGFTASFIEENEAWRWILQAARTLQCAYDSWAALGRDFVLGFEFWRHAADIPGEFHPSPFFIWLKRDPQSPWRRLPWNASLSA